MSYVVHELSAIVQMHLLKHAPFYKGSRLLNNPKWKPVFESKRKKQPAIDFAKNNDFCCIVSDHWYQNIYHNEKPVKIRD